MIDDDRMMSKDSLVLINNNKLTKIYKKRLILFSYLYILIFFLFIRLMKNFFLKNLHKN